MTDLPAATALLGRRIVVTRARAQAADLADALLALGAVPLLFPTIRIAPMEDLAPLDEAIQALSSYDWVVFTSVNGVHHFWDRLRALGLDHTAFATSKVAAIGPATAEALQEAGLTPTFVPDEFVAERIAEGLEACHDLSGRRVLLPRAQLARKALAHLLRAQGAHVDDVAIYQTLTGTPDASALETLSAGVDALTFTSSSTVRNFKALAEAHQLALPPETVVACIGPITAETARSLGYHVDLVAQQYTIPGLVEALALHFTLA